MTAFDITTIGLVTALCIGAGIIVWLWRSAPLDHWDEPDHSMFEDGEDKP